MYRRTHSHFPSNLPSFPCLPGCDCVLAFWLLRLREGPCSPHNCKLWLAATIASSSAKAGLHESSSQARARFWHDVPCDHGHSSHKERPGGTSWTCGELTSSEANWPQWDRRWEGAERETTQPFLRPPLTLPMHSGSVSSWKHQHGRAINFTFS